MRRKEFLLFFLLERIEPFSKLRQEASRFIRLRGKRFPWLINPLFRFSSSGRFRINSWYRYFQSRGKRKIGIQSADLVERDVARRLIE